MQWVYALLFSANHCVKGFERVFHWTTAGTRCKQPRSPDKESCSAFVRFCPSPRIMTYGHHVLVGLTYECLCVCIQYTLFTFFLFFSPSGTDTRAVAVGEAGDIPSGLLLMVVREGRTPGTAVVHEREVEEGELLYNRCAVQMPVQSPCHGCMSVHVFVSVHVLAG